MHITTFSSVPYAQIADIDFSAPTQKQRKTLEQSFSVPQSSSIVPSSKATPSTAELNSLYRELSKSGKPAILSIIPAFSDSFVPLCEQGVILMPLTNFYREEYLSMSYHDLLAECEVHFNTIEVTAEQSKIVEEITRGQSASKHWFQQ